MSDTITVVAVTYSPGEALLAFVDTLRRATTAPLKILLVDNGSTDGSVERMVGHDDVRLIRAGSNVGYGVAANLGVAASDSELVVVANPDVEWHPGSLDRLIDAARRYPDGGAFGPLVITANGDVYPSARRLPSLKIGIGHALLGFWWPRNPFTVAYRVDDQPPKERAAGWLSGCCMLLRRSAFEEVSGFDPDFFMYFEDVDLCERLAQAGWASVYVPSATITHTRAHITSRHATKMAIEHHRSAWRYLSRRYPGITRWPLRTLLRLGLTVRSVLAQHIPRLATGGGAERQWLGNGDTHHLNGHSHGTNGHAVLGEVPLQPIRLDREEALVRVDREDEPRSAS